MNFKILNKILLFIVLCVQSLMLCACSGKESVVCYDSQGEELATLSSSDPDKWILKDEDHRTYLEIVIDEAAKDICDKGDYTEAEAVQKIFAENYEIYTAFDESVFQSLKKSYEMQEMEGVSFAGTVTDLNGKLVAACSVANNNDNNATIKRTSYTTMAPLAVYSPAIDAGIINWSKTYKVEKETKNVKEAVVESINSITEDILKEYGALNAMYYMKQNYFLSLKEEERGLNGDEADDVIKNIASGYIQEGVSPVDMAGYYQIFANGGVYIKPKAIIKICDSAGNVLCQEDSLEEQVIKKETANIMNHLLRISTYDEAQELSKKYRAINAGGKSGTGNGGCWFVGFTPKYSCAIWHGSEVKENNAKDMFIHTFSEDSSNLNLEYPECRTVFEAVYCKESGKLLSEKCKIIENGFYALDDDVEICNEH